MKSLLMETKKSEMIKPIYISRLLIIFLFLPIPLINAQSLIQEPKADFIFFEDCTLIETLETIIQDKNECENGSKYYWYIHFYSSKKILVKEGRLSIFMRGKLGSQQKKIFATSINHKIVFVVMDPDDASISKTNFSFDLSKYIDEFYIIFEDLSEWLVLRDDSKYRLADSRIRKCN